MAPLTITLNDGNTIPWLGFGTGTALYNKEVKKEVLVAINAGIHHLDGAQVYGNEASIGDAIAESGLPRSDFYVTTKLAQIPQGQTVKDTVVESLRKLKLDYVDQFLIHTPKYHANLKAVWKEVEGLKKEGLAKTIGVSNFQVKHLEEIVHGAEIIPAINQLEYHPYVFKATEPVIQFQKKFNIVTTSFGGLSPITRFAGGPIDAVLEKIAKQLGDERGKAVTSGQILQLWLRKKGIPAISTSRKVERLQEYLDVETLRDLTAEEEKEIDDVGSTVHHRVFAKWIDEEASKL